MNALAGVHLGALAADVAAGLARHPKSLPPYLFYDAAGSELFEQITALPEYYLTRTELQILREHAAEMAAALSPIASAIELGAGSAAKTGVFLEALRRRSPRLTYWGIDISPTALEEARNRLARVVPGLRVRTAVRDYVSQDLPPTEPPRLVLYLGSSIGNFEPPQAAALLRRIARQVGRDGALLLGVDLRKPAALLLPAYDDAQGVTARFNLNMLARLNRELEADFDLQAFRHIALWNPQESRMEMYLESRRDQVVRIRTLDLTVRFARGERLHTENSYKHTPESVRRLLLDAGFLPQQAWTDPDRWFALHLARPAL